MQNIDLTTELYISPMRDRNNEKYGSGDFCICCGKPIKDMEKTKWVHMNEGWLALHSSVSYQNCFDLTGYNSQGCFPIGNECAKKMPKNFVHSGIK